MARVLGSFTSWSYGRFFEGRAPIRIAVPSWWIKGVEAATMGKAARVSREELLQLFQTELRPMKKPAVVADADLTRVEMQQRVQTRQVRAALYTS